MANKQELTGKKYSLKCRLRLFESVLTPTVLYGDSSSFGCRATEAQNNATTNAPDDVWHRKKTHDTY